LETYRSAAHKALKHALWAAGRSNAVHVLLLLELAELPHSKGLGSFQLLCLLERLRILGLFRVFGCHFRSSFQFELFCLQPENHIFNELDIRRGLVRYFDFGINKRLGNFQLLHFFEQLRLFGLFVCHFLALRNFRYLPTSYSLPSFAKDELTINGFVASNFLALCSTLLFFGVIFLVAIFIPLFSLIFHWLPDPAPLSLLTVMHFTRQGRRISAFGQVILFAADP
jgi:hypothetical protein